MDSAMPSVPQHNVGRHMVRYLGMHILRSRDYQRPVVSSRLRIVLRKHGVGRGNMNIIVNSYNN